MSDVAPRRKSQTLAIIASAIGLLSLIPLLGLLSILALLLSIIALIRNASAFAFVALLIALFSIATSPSVWILTGLGVGTAVLSAASNSDDSPNAIERICGQEIHSLSKLNVNETYTCEINNVGVSCVIFDTYAKNDQVLCDEAKQNMLPKPTAEGTQL